MSGQTSSKSGLFLMELIILILFFSIAGAICVRLFVNAHLNAKESAELNKAVLAAQSAVEIYKGSDNPEESLKKWMGAYETDEGFFIAYDTAWEPLQSETGATFFLQIYMTESGRVGEADVRITSADILDQPIYEVTAKKLL